MSGVNFIHCSDRMKNNDSMDHSQNEEKSFEEGSNDKFLFKDHQRYQAEDDNQNDEKDHELSGDKGGDESIDKYLAAMQDNNEDENQPEEKPSNNRRGNRNNRGNRNQDFQVQKEEKPSTQHEQKQNQQQQEPSPRRGRGRGNRIPNNLSDDQKPLNDEFKESENKNIDQDQQKNEDAQSQNEPKNQSQAGPQDIPRADDSAWDDQPQQQPPQNNRARRANGQHQSPQIKPQQNNVLDGSNWEDEANEEANKKVQEKPSRRGRAQKEEEQNELEPDQDNSDWNKNQRKVEEQNPNRGRARRGNRQAREQQGEQNENNNEGGYGRGRGNRNYNQNYQNRPQYNRGENNYNQDRGGREFQGSWRGNRGGHRGGFRGNQDRDDQNQPFNNDRNGRNFQRRNFNNDRQDNRNFDRQNNRNFNDRQQQRQEQSKSQSNQMSAFSNKSQLPVYNAVPIIEPKGIEGWPQVSFYIRKCKISVTLRNINQHKADAIVFPFQDMNFKLYPSTLICENSKCNYRKKIQQKFDLNYWADKNFYPKKGEPIGNFNDVLFCKVSNRQSNDFKQVCLTLFKFMNMEKKSKSVVFPVCKQLGGFDVLLNSAIQGLHVFSQKNQAFIERFEFTTKDPEYFKQVSRIFLGKIIEHIDSNQIYIL